MFTITDNRLISCNINQDTIAVPEGVEIVESKAFEHCGAATRVVLPDSVKTIREGAFSGASAIQRIDIGKGIETIETGAFSDEDSWWKAKEIHFACPAAQPRISPLAGNKGLQWNATVTFPDIGTRPFGGLPTPADLTAREAQKLFVAKKSRSTKAWTLDLVTDGRIIENKIQEVYRPEVGKMMGQFYEKETDFHVSIPDTVEGSPVEKFSMGILPPNAILYASPKWFDKAAKSVRSATAVAWLEGDPLFSEAEIERIESFIKKNSADVAESLMNSKSPSAHARFSQMVKLKPELVDRLIEAASGQTEIAACWMDYKNSVKKPKKAEDSLRLDAPKPPTMAVLKKLWTFQTYLDEDGQDCADITGYKGQEAHVIVPDKIGKYKVVAVRNAFAKADHVESIQFENTDIEIRGTFKYCPKLANSDGFIILAAGERRVLTDYIGKGIDVHVPEGVTEIRSEAISARLKPWELHGQTLVVHLPHSVKQMSDSALFDQYTEFITWSLAENREIGGEVIPVEIHVANPNLKLATYHPSERLSIFAPSGSQAEAFARAHDLAFHEE